MNSLIPWEREDKIWKTLFLYSQKPPKPVVWVFPTGRFSDPSKRWAVEF